MRARMILGLLWGVTVCGLATSSVWAAPISIRYGFDNGQAGGQLAATAVLENGLPSINLTASAITPSGFTGPVTAAGPADAPTANQMVLATTNGGNPGGHLSVYFTNTVAGTNNTEALVAGLGQYFSMVIAPAAGYTLDLTRLAVDYTASNDSNGRTFFVRYNHSGVPNNFAGPSLAGATYPTVGPDAWQNDIGGATNLSSIPLINSGESVTLRFFIYRTTANATAQNIRFDDIVITGDLVAVPEPASWFALGLVFTGLTLGKFRRVGTSMANGRE